MSNADEASPVQGDVRLPDSTMQAWKDSHIPAHRIAAAEITLLREIVAYFEAITPASIHDRIRNLVTKPNSVIIHVCNFPVEDEKYRKRTR